MQVNKNYQFKIYSTLVVIAVVLLTLQSHKVSAAVKPCAESLFTTCNLKFVAAPIGADGQKIYTRITEFINLLSGLVGILVVGSIIVGGIQYTTAGSDPQKVSSAKRRILNSIFAFLAFIFMYAFLQYIIPGGAF